MAQRDEDKERLSDDAIDAYLNETQWVEGTPPRLRLDDEKPAMSFSTSIYTSEDPRLLLNEIESKALRLTNKKLKNSEKWIVGLVLLNRLLDDADPTEVRAAPSLRHYLLSLLDRFES